MWSVFRLPTFLQNLIFYLFLCPAAQADADVSSLSAATSALSSKFASSVGALGMSNNDLRIFQDATSLGNLGGTGQFDSAASMDQLLKFTPSLQQQFQQQLAASEQGLNSLQRHIDLSKLVGGGLGGNNGLLLQSAGTSASSAVSAQHQSVLASHPQASQQQHFVDNQKQGKPDSRSDFDL